MNKFTPLPRPFYEPSAKTVAPKLLGEWLIRQTPQGLCGGPIVEAEAYLVGDPAAHSYSGPTDRNRIMFGPPGHAYVYFIYGNHYCFNAVCRPAGIGEAVLVRAIEPLVGLEMMEARRAVVNSRNLTNGPGKLCSAMDIDRNLDGADLCNAESPLFIAQNPELKSFLEQRGSIITTTRVGITKAASLALRFYLEGSPFVSRKQPKPLP